MKNIPTRNDKVNWIDWMKNCGGYVHVKEMVGMYIQKKEL